MAYIVENGKRINYTIEGGKVIYSDGKEAIPSIENIDIKLAFKNATYPKPIDPPVIIHKEYVIGAKELSSLKNAEKAVFILKPGEYYRSDIENLHDVVIDGQNKVVFKNSRAIQFNGSSFSDVSIKNMAFQNISDYCIDFWGLGNLEYTKAAGSFIDGVSFENLTADNCGTLIHMDGGLDGSRLMGVVKNLIIKGIVFKNSPEPRSVVYLGNGMNYNISDCLIDNINRLTNEDRPNGAHNGIFQLGGNGKFHNNKVINHQGNAVRAWLFSHEGTQNVEIFNNIVWNSLVYSAFEAQAKHSGNTSFKPADLKVYNNTAGLLNTQEINGEHYFEGQLLDLYNTGGKVEYFNNLGFEMNRKSGKVTDMINYNGNGTSFHAYGNKYFDTAKEAVVDTVNFKSLHKGIGAQ